jgi:hypothetical protein
LYRLSPDLGNFFDLSQPSCAQGGNIKEEQSAFKGKNRLP